MSWVISKITATNGAEASSPCCDPEGKLITYRTYHAAQDVVARLMTKPPLATTFVVVPVSHLSQAAQSRIARQESA